MKIVICGTTGFIGSALKDYFLKENIDVIPIFRSDFKYDRLISLIEGKDVVINLAGERIEGIWSNNKKKKILESRINTTRIIVEAINNCNIPPKLFINSSGVGIYDDSFVHDEKSKNYGHNFLSETVIKWENELSNIKNDLTRVVIIRLGLVLGKSGFLKKFSLPYRVRLGINLGFYEKGFSFIHIGDLIQIINHIISEGNIDGVVNVVAPEYSTSSFTFPFG